MEHLRVAISGMGHVSARDVNIKLNDITRAIFREDDDKILTYLEEEGKTVEPKWYLPILPMILVNGGNGIALGWKSYVPSYDPKDIIKNIIRYKNAENMIPMKPWFKGFDGTIVEDSERKGYWCESSIKKLSSGRYQINLPIGKTTKRYKSFLSSIMKREDNMVKNPLIESFDEPIGNDRKFIIQFLPNKVPDSHEKIIKELKLKRHISTDHMYLLDKEDKIHKYTDLEILKEFIPIRLEGYQKRKDNMVKCLFLHEDALKNKIRFIEIVTDNWFELLKKSEEGVCLTLQEHNINNIEELLCLPIRAFLPNNLKKLKDEHDRIVLEMEKLNNTTVWEMWEKDLHEFESLWKKECGEDGDTNSCFPATATQLVP